MEISGLADNAAAEVVQEIHRGLTVPLADAPADDRLLRPGHADENVLVALGVDFVALDVLLLLADERPRFVKLQPLGADSDHQTVVQFHAPHADAQRQAAHGATVDAGQARGGTDADAFAKGGNDFNLLFAGEYVHEGQILGRGRPGDGSGNIARQGVYSFERSFSLGPNPGVDDRGSIARQRRRPHLIDDGGSGEDRTHGTLRGGWMPKRPPRGKLGAIGHSATLPHTKAPRQPKGRWGVRVSVCF